MRDVQKLRELLERCEKATGPDRLLDHDILLGLGWSAPPVYHETRANAGVWVDEDDGPDTFIEFAKNPDRHAGFWHTPDGSYAGDELPRLTASLDASIALVERMIPGWRVNLSAPVGIAWLSHPEGTLSGYAEAQAETPPLAILSALLRALISQAEGEGAQHG